MSFISAIKNLLTPNKHYFVRNKGITVIRKIKMNGTIVVNSYNALKYPIKTVVKTPLNKKNVSGHITEITDYTSNKKTKIQKYAKLQPEETYNILTKKLIAKKDETIKTFMKNSKYQGLPTGIYFYRAEYPTSINQLKITYEKFGKPVSAEQIKTCYNA